MTTGSSGEMVCNEATVQDTEVSGGGPVTLQSCQTEALSDVALSDKLTVEDTRRIKSILHGFFAIFSDKSRVVMVELDTITLTIKKVGVPY